MPVPPLGADSPEPTGRGLPASRRLLLEAAPRRPANRSLPYGGPALRGSPSSPPGGLSPDGARVGRDGPAGSSSDVAAPDDSCGSPTWGLTRTSVDDRLTARVQGDTPNGAPGGVKAARSSIVRVRPLAKPHSEPWGSGPKVPSLRVLRPHEPGVAAPTVPPPEQSVPARTAAEQADSREEITEGAAVSSARLRPEAEGTGTRQRKGSPKTAHANKRQWLLSVVRENFNEQMGLLVERFVRRPSKDKSVRRVPGVGRKVNVNLQAFWRRSSGQERHMTVGWRPKPT